jgi:hypothetical protein
MSKPGDHVVKTLENEYKNLQGVMHTHVRNVREKAMALADEQEKHNMQLRALEEVAKHLDDISGVDGHHEHILKTFTPEVNYVVSKNPVVGVDVEKEGDDYDGNFMPSSLKDN